MGRTLSRPHKIQKVKATLELAGETFTFQLFTRPIKLGDPATVQYYWIDGSHFRKLKSDADCACFRNVLGHWAAAMRYERCMHEIDQQLNIVLAEIYAYVSKDKTLQDVYLDAHVKKKLTRSEEHSLPPESQKRIQAVVKSQDRFLFQAELDRTLRFQPLPREYMAGFQKAAQHWLGNGITALRKDGNDGLRRYIENELMPWLCRFRKRSDPRVRAFINAFSYECKVAFYTCYANVWVDLIPWLRVHRDLDPISEKFLWFWHRQNHAIEIPAGQTASGIVYPTQRGAQVVETLPNGQQRLSSVVVPAERIGPEYVSDVFRGQVLALHPLSAFFMQDRGLCAIAGSYFASDLHALERVGLVGKNYWDFMGAILTAASLYRQAYDVQGPTRDLQFRGGGEIIAASTGNELSVSGQLADFLLATGHKCASCGRELQFVRKHPIETEQKVVKVDYACASCPGEVTFDVDREEFTDFIRD